MKIITDDASYPKVVVTLDELILGCGVCVQGLVANPADTSQYPIQVYLQRDPTSQALTVSTWNHDEVPVLSSIVSAGIEEV